MLESYFDEMVSVKFAMEDESFHTPTNRLALMVEWMYTLCGERVEDVFGVKSRDTKSKLEGIPVTEMNAGALMELSSPPEVQFVKDVCEIFNSSSSPTLTSTTLPLPSFRWIPTN